MVPWRGVPPGEGSRLGDSARENSIKIIDAAIVKWMSAFDNFSVGNKVLAFVKTCHLFSFRFWAGSRLSAF